jgi:hypothetical protein
VLNLITRFHFPDILQGAPKNQCANNYDCRNFNDPGSVNVCCDYCEQVALVFVMHQIPCRLSLIVLSTSLLLNRHRSHHIVIEGQS